MHRWITVCAGVSASLAFTPAGAALSAQDKSDVRQIADAVSPLPEPLREAAAVRGIAALVSSRCGPARTG
jgi:hypothetical protein